MRNGCGSIVVLVAVIVSSSRGAERDPGAVVRTPVALAVVGEELLVANRTSGTVSVVDVERAWPVGRVQVGGTLSDMVATPDGRHVYVTDEAAGELIRLTRDLRVDARLKVPAYPVTVRLAKDVGTVAGLWSRRLAVVDLDAMRVRHVVDLPFAPREQLVSPDGQHVLVADSFGGSFARVDLVTGEIISRGSIDAHNVRGLAWTPDGRGLLVAHQMLDGRTAAERSRVSWGQVVGNVLRAVPSSELARGDDGPVRHWSLYPMGSNGRGAGDPGAILVTPTGLTAVALSGVHEVAVRRSPLDSFTRIPVGRRPVDVVASADGSRLYVANASDDSISVIDTQKLRVVSTIPLGRRPNPIPERALGEQLFYDARLSLDGWYSCHSCHSDGHANGGRNDNLSDGSFGTPKQIPTLMGVEETRPWGWTGRMQTHEMQVHQSILGTMHGPPSGASADNVNAIAAFIRSLPPAPPVAAARGESIKTNPAVARGREIFADLRCGRCHHVPEFTSERSYDVELPDEAGEAYFNPPSLQGVSQRDAFLHDGRAKSLHELLTKHRHPNGKGIEDRSVDDVVAYLRSL